jgi:hydroxypyruvate reductase
LVEREFKVVAVLSHGGRWVPDATSESPSVEDMTGGYTLVSASRSSEALRRALYAETASHGTDGSDGPTDAAGAIVDGNTIRRGTANGMVAREFLARNDAYHFLQATDDLLKTGPTLTNVMDLHLVLVG